ncbi:hypothetical protein AKJ09_06498 [Labilithrix luteola]|uniref:Uncharacterized protein n=1 Tax=Labilithrix luteola TaxID=1391654 RepID=A0A0K1Q392_9BACT|nr:hypothetical protein [Labilithrix luteola]AKU99834.1 hypothetical protein AKJ09_06498 [Labilithrix luteola]
MSKLSPKERALFETARKGWGPSTSSANAARAGIDARLRRDPDAGREGPGPNGNASFTTSPSPGRAFLRSPWGVVTGLAALSLFTIAGIRSLTSAHEAQTPSAAVDPSTVVLSERESPPSAPASTTVSISALPDAFPDAPADPKKTASTRTTNSPSSGAATRQPGGIAEEVALVRAAQKSLRDGSPSDALVTLDSHAERFPRGALREERMTLQVLALCALGDLSKARRARAELEKLAPASSHLQRLDCAAP